MKPTNEIIHQWANCFFKDDAFGACFLRNELYKDFKNHYPDATVKIRMFSSFLILWALGNNYRSLCDGRTKYILFKKRKNFNMLKVNIKSNRSTCWEMRVRMHLKQLSKDCTCLYSLEYSLMEELRKYPQESVSHISTSYKCKIEDGKLNVYHWPATLNTRLIAIVEIINES